MIGMTYKVGITSVASVEDFYVYIPEIAAHTLTGSLEDFKKQINAADMVEKYQPYKFPGPGRWSLLVYSLKNYKFTLNGT